jgi:rhomboid protease GluP
MASGLWRSVAAVQAPITRALLGLCVLTFALSSASAHTLPIWPSARFAISTMIRFGALFADSARLEPFRYLASVFVHFNVLHLLMNGWSLSSIGPSAEREFGSARFALLFISCGVLGFVASEQWYGAAPHLTAGASGAIFGCVGSMIGLGYARRAANRHQVLSQNVVNLVILGMVFPVNNAAHVAGFLVGALLGYLFDKEPRGAKLDWVFRVLAALCLLLSPISLALSNASPVWREARAAEADSAP